MPKRKHKHKGSEINLLPKEGLAATTSGRILLWILTTFRIVLIITELIVIFAFLSRFWLDAKNTDLTDKVNDAKARILSLSEFEKDFKGTQEKLKVYETYKQGKGVLLKGVDEMVAYKPIDVFFTNVSSDYQKVTVKAITPSENAILQYVENLKSSELFEEVKIQDLSVSESESLFKFTISSYYKKQ